MGLFKIWKDHVTQYSNRYREVQNADGTITHEAVEGEVVQEGTPQNAQNFNDLEERILSAGLIANLATYIATPTTTVIALYCWKAKAENIIKIKKGYPEETKDISVDLNNINI